MKDYVEYGTRKIDYALTFSQRKTLGITVTPAMEVKVFAPAGADPEQVRARVKRRARWIVNQLSYFLAFHPRRTMRRYISGETHYYMGRQYMLRIEQGETPAVRLRGGILEVVLESQAQNDATGVNLTAQEAVERWYFDHATRRFEEIAAPLIAQFKRYGVEPKELILKRMATRWGSCTAQGRIVLNPDLIQAPRGCIEYVIIHELCHLVHLNHTERFFALQSREMPDWEKWKERLERLMA